MCRSHAAGAHMPRPRPQIPLGPECYPDKEVAELDASPQQPSEPDHTVATTKSRKQGSLVRNLLPAICHPNANKGCIRLGGNAVHRLAEGCVHPVQPGWQCDLGLELMRQRQSVADRAHASNCVQRERDDRRAWADLLGWRMPTAEFRMVFVGARPATLVAGALFPTLGKVAQRENLNGCAEEHLARWRPEPIVAWFLHQLFAAPAR
eukprot:7382373-Prymnesium_polylepis.1